MRIIQGITAFSYFFSLFLVIPAFAEEGNICGDYKINGQLSCDFNDCYLIVHKGSRSEIRLIFPRKSYLHFIAYKDRAVAVNGKLLKPIKSYRGSFFPINIRERVPNPLHPLQDENLNLRAAHSCNGED